MGGEGDAARGAWSFARKTTPEVRGDAFGTKADRRSETRNAQLENCGVQLQCCAWGAMLRWQAQSDPVVRAGGYRPVTRIQNPLVVLGRRRTATCRRSLTKPPFAAALLALAPNRSEVERPVTFERAWREHGPREETFRVAHHPSPPSILVRSNRFCKSCLENCAYQQFASNRALAWTRRPQAP